MIADGTGALLPREFGVSKAHFRNLFHHLCSPYGQALHFPYGKSDFVIG